WYLNNTAVSGANASSWTFTPTSTGFYTVYVNVTDSVGVKAKSNISSVTVNPALSVSISPTSATIDLGQSKPFTSTVSGGTPPYSYQWYLNDTAVSGANASSWTFAPTSAGFYTVYLNVTDGTGATAKSNIAIVTVNPALAVFISPTTVTINLGQSVTFSSTVSGGTSPYFYQWYLNGAAVSGAINPNWTFTPTSTGFYTVYLNVSDSADVDPWAISNIVNVTVNPQLTASISPPSTTITLGQSVLFTAIVSGGTSPYSYKWDVNGTWLPEETNPTLNFTPTQPGIYNISLLVTDSASTNASAFASVTVQPLKYYLTVETDPADITTIPGEGWYDNCTYVTLTAPQFVPSESGVSGQRYRFDHWTVDEEVFTALNITVHMDANHTAIAHYVLQYYLSMSTNFGTVAPGSGWHDAGSTFQISASAPGVVDGERYVWLGWTGSGDGSYTGMDNPATVTMYGPITQTASWRHEYRLIMNTNFGTTNPSVGEHWYEAGSPVTISATPPSVISGERYVWLGWTGTGTGSYSGTANPASITMNGPITETAAWRHEYYLTVTSPYDTPTPTSGWFEAGTPITASVTSPVTGPTGTRYVCTGWTGTGSVPASGTGTSVSFTINAPSSITWTWKTQYLLTVRTDPAGLSPQPTRNPAGEAGSGGWWYDSTTSVQLTAQPVTNYDFLYWDVDGTSQGDKVNPITVPMDGPHTATAHYEWVTPPPSVGGYAVHIDVAIGKEVSHSLTSQISLAFAILAAMVASILLTRRRSRRLK
ncbi:MAG: PKD domain-containing protein, partial [Candidatus Bathyarchaeaceae archaeon]